MRTLLARFIKDESGSTAVEYTLIAAGIAIAILTAVNALGGSLASLFGSAAGKLGGGANAGAAN